MSKNAKIAGLNDALRCTFTDGRIFKTDGIDALDAYLQGKILEAVRTFAKFAADNDPYGEHDFGAIEVAGRRCFWKIDLYEKTVVKGSAVSGSLRRCNNPHAPLGSADTPRRHRNSRRSNRPSWASFAARIACRRVYTGMHRLASFLWPDCRTVGT